MKIKFVFISLLSLSILSSCIKDEPLNREADIEYFNLPNKVLTDVLITDNEVKAIVKTGTDISQLAPILKLTPGARATPASGEVIDFSKGPITYTITSEDGAQYQKTYTVSVELFNPIMEFDFEEWGVGGTSQKYPTPKDIAWTTANSGIVMAYPGGPPDGIYPTRQTTDAYAGKYGAMLETLKGKNVMNIIDIPVFPGSLFTGSFLVISVKNPLTSTRFGRNHPREKGRPVLFNGYYKYSPGAEFTTADGSIDPGRVDECSIYAILYKVSLGEGIKQDEYLDGTNIQSSGKVVAKAIWPSGAKQETFKEFSILFTYSEEPDYTKYDYKLAVVFSSSKDGDRFEGAIGSQLIVDEVKVTCEEYDYDDEGGNGK